MRIERFEDIEAWQLAWELTRKVYGLTKKAKFAREFGLKRQSRMQRVHLKNNPELLNLEPVNAYKKGNPKR